MSYSLRTPLGAIAPACVLLGAALSATPAFAVGGTGGNSFSIQCGHDENLTKVVVRSGKRIDALGIECKGPKGTRTLRVGGNGGSQHEIKVSPDRWLYEVVASTGKCGKSTERVCSLLFKFREGGQSQTFGNFGDKGPHVLGGDKKREIYGFSGRAGAEIDAIDVLTRPAVFRGDQEIDAKKVADELNNLLHAMQVRLHNLGPRHGNSFELKNASSIKLAGKTHTFSIDEYAREFKVLRVLALYYVNDIRSKNVSLRFDGKNRRFVLRIEFEDTDSELKGLCRYNSAGPGWTDCKDRLVPDVNWRNPAVEITMVPEVYNGGGLNGIYLRATAVNVLGDFKANGVCGLGNECQTILGKWKDRLRGKMEAQMLPSINGAEIRKSQAIETRKLLDKYGFQGKITSVGISDSKLVIGL